MKPTFKFKCSRCGKCCRNMKEVIESIPELEKIIGVENTLHFPYSHNNGVCEKLSENNLCMIYEERPTICNTEKLAKLIAESINKDVTAIQKGLYEQLELLCGNEY